MSSFLRNCGVTSLGKVKYIGLVLNKLIEVRLLIIIIKSCEDDLSAVSPSSDQIEKVRVLLDLFRKWWNCYFWEHGVIKT